MKIFLKRSFFCWFCLVFLLLNQSLANATEHTDCATRVLDDVLTTLEKQTDMKQKRQAVVDKYYRLIDFEWNARMALGRPYKDLNDVDKKEYLKEYTKFVAYSWLPKLNYDRSLNLKFNVKKNSEKLGKQDERVCIEITAPDSAKYEVYVRIRYFPDTKTCKILDVDVEGVDLALSYRAQFESYIEANGGRATSILSFLKEKNKEYKKNVDFKLPVD